MHVNLLPHLYLMSIENKKFAEYLGKRNFFIDSIGNPLEGKLVNNESRLNIRRSSVYTPIINPREIWEADILLGCWENSSNPLSLRFRDLDSEESFQEKYKRASRKILRAWSIIFSLISIGLSISMEGRGVSFIELICVLGMCVLNTSFLMVVNSPLWKFISQQVS